MPADQTLSRFLRRRSARIGLLATSVALIVAATAGIASRDQPLVALGCLSIGLVGLVSLKLAAEAHTSIGAARHRLDLIEDEGSTTRGEVAKLASGLAAHQEQSEKLASGLADNREQHEMLVSGLAEQRARYAELAEKTERELAEVRRQWRATTERHLRLEQRVRQHWRQLQTERLAPASEHESSADLPPTDPSSVLAVVEAVESGAIPSEQISDSFPEESVGLSGRRFRTLICALVDHYSARGAYLEVGTYLGKTICTSALANPSVRHIGVDDFSQVNEGGRNRDLFFELVRKSGATNIDFFEEDFLEFLTDRTVAGTQDISVYYFDASHDYRSQLLALLHGSRQSISGGLMLVDDCNYSHVRAASYDFCASHPEWALLFERYTAGHPSHVESEEDVRQRDEWWNGVHVLIHDPRFELERLERQPDERLDRSFRTQHSLSNCYVDGVQSRRARLTNSRA